VGEAIISDLGTQREALERARYPEQTIEPIFVIFVSSLVKFEKPIFSLKKLSPYILVGFDLTTHEYPETITRPVQEKLLFTYSAI
jgi:hypothetical protein